MVYRRTAIITMDKKSISNEKRLNETPRSTPFLINDTIMAP
jgi:hypothetical protein